MATGALDIALNLATFLGILILAVPVWSLNQRKKKLQQVREAMAAPDRMSDLRTRLHAILRDRRERDVVDWRPIDERCLILGYLLLLGSAAMRVVLPLVS